MINFAEFEFAAVLDLPDELPVFDLTESYEPEIIAAHRWGIGRYNEKRKQMYLAPQYEGRRDIHMGIDFWCPPGEPVYAFYDGEIAYFADNDQKGNYGPTIVTRHRLDGVELFALYGHLTRASVDGIARGQPVSKGDRLGAVGTSDVNGGWAPHLHFQISMEDPGKADMPGVVADDDLEEALEKYPDPRLIVGSVY